MYFHITYDQRYVTVEPLHILTLFPTLSSNNMADAQNSEKLVNVDPLNLMTH